MRHSRGSVEREDHHRRDEIDQGHAVAGDVGVEEQIARAKSEAAGCHAGEGEDRGQEQNERCSGLGWTGGGENGLCQQANYPETNEGQDCRYAGAGNFHYYKLCFVNLLEFTFFASFYVYQRSMRR